MKLSHFAQIVSIPVYSSLAYKISTKNTEYYTVQTLQSQNLEPHYDQI